jgi:hypothetical protein
MAKNDTASHLKNYRFEIGNTSSIVSKIVIKQFDDDAIDWTKGSVEIIGTIGTDILNDKIIVIDYGHKTISISDKLPTVLESKILTDDFHFAHGKIMMIASIKDKPTMLYFDSGSSSFELITDKETAQMLSIQDAVTERYAVNSWGKSMTANSVTSADSVFIGGEKIPLRRVTWFEGASQAQVEQMKRIGIGGMTGNKLFADCILVLDVKRKKMTVMYSR